MTLWAGLVNVFHWSPEDATAPFAIMGGLFVGGTLQWVVWTARHIPRVHQPWVCAKCGYLLYGLIEPRCPECARPFDSAVLRLAPPASEGPPSGSG